MSEKGETSSAWYRAVLIRWWKREGRNDKSSNNMKEGKERERGRSATKLKLNVKCSSEIKNSNHPIISMRRWAIFFDTLLPNTNSRATKFSDAVNVRRREWTCQNLPVLLRRTNRPVKSPDPGLSLALSCRSDWLAWLTPNKPASILDSQLCNACFSLFPGPVQPAHTPHTLRISPHNQRRSQNALQKISSDIQVLQDGTRQFFTHLGLMDLMRFDAVWWDLISLSMVLFHTKYSSRLDGLHYVPSVFPPPPALDLSILWHLRSTKLSKSKAVGRRLESPSSSEKSLALQVTTSKLEQTNYKGNKFKTKMLCRIPKTY